MDTFLPEKRSALMRRVKQKHTKPEMLIRRLLWKMGYRYRLHVKTMPGTPDIVFPGRHKVVLCHGCFWHGHDGCQRSKLPQTNLEFWERKISGNKVRDKRDIETLISSGWKVLVVWECETRDLNSLRQKLIDFLG